MSTRSLIGILNEDESVTCVYCHFDGYPKGVGRVLYENYNTVEKVEKLISGGDMSSIHQNVESVDYYVNRGEELKIWSYKNESVFFALKIAEYQYLFKDGRWFFRKNKLDIEKQNPIPFLPEMFMNKHQLRKSKIKNISQILKK